MSFSSKGKHHPKTRLKIEMACRLEIMNLGLQDSEIARQVGMSQTSYSILKKTKLYQVIRTQFLSGVLSEADREVAVSLEYQREKLAAAVPIALENLVQLAAQKLDKNLQFKASTEILDRHGYHAKVTRIGAPTKEQGAGELKDNELAAELINASAKQRAAQDIITLNTDPIITINDAPVTEVTQ